MKEWFRRATPEVLALPQTVFSDHDEVANRLVFGVENPAAIRGVEAVLSHLGIPRSAFEIRVTEPIRFLAGTLREVQDPRVGGIQIHFSNYLCTLGFSADHIGGRSFITNSHCTGTQGTIDGTAYYQPLSSISPSPIAFEVDDPAYFKGAGCPPGRKCRYSDAARALYVDGVENRGEIARTSGPNSGSLTLVGTFDITSQDDSHDAFVGTLNKVGRTTGWTQGGVVGTCATVNVSGSNITLLCQTLVQNSSYVIVGGGDSGSPVFQETANNTARLVGILWGGSSSGDMFVFSPLKNIQGELGSLDVTTDGSGGGGGNIPPVASFTYSCSDLSCGFTDTSTDTDGTVVSWSWDFGDGSSVSNSQDPSHTYASYTTYTVSLTVTDNGGASNTISQAVTVTSPTEGLTLTATGRTAGKNYFADLAWSGAGSATVVVLRNGVSIATTANDGAFSDKLRVVGTYTYQVCEYLGGKCSNVETVTFN